MLKKITEGNISGLNVKSVPGVRLTGTVAENKNVFDKLPEFIAQTYNSLIDALSSSADGDSGANCINITPIAGLTGTEVQTVIESVKALLDTMYNSSEVDEKLALKADKAVTDKHYKDVTFNEKTGVFTFIREDGTTKAIDTLLEKILVNFAYDPETQTINFTAEDGTVYPVSISDFVTINEFSDSDVIDFTVLKGVVSANIKAGSITEPMLNVTFKQSLEALKAAAETAAANAKASETNAKTYSERAKASENTASVKASESAQSANQSAESALSAESSAKSAESYAVGGTGTRDGEDTDNARYYKIQSEVAKRESILNAQTATEKANIAVANAEIATNKATSANASEAKATEGAATATAKAQEAVTANTNAQAAKNTAVQAEAKATSSADTATKASASADVSAKAAKAAQLAAEQARDEAEAIAGGDYATKPEVTAVDGKLNTHIADKVVHITSAERTSWNNKVDKVSGKGLSTNDYTTAEKNKVTNIPSDTNASLANKVDKVNGKGLSTNDYTTAEKGKVANVPTNTNTELSKKENKSTVSVITLSAATWDKSAKTYSLESQYPHANYNIEIALDSSATAEQAEAFNGAQIVGNAASNVIKAYGDVPTVDIPVILKVVAK